MFKSKNIAALLFILSYMFTSNMGYCDLVNYLKAVGPKNAPSRMRNIDFIYIINLDRRPERLQRSLQQLAPYGIYPHRFSAIDGWALPSEVLNDLGVTFTPESRRCPKPDLFGAYFSKDNHQIVVDLDETCYGKKFLSNHMRRGAIGCYLSHLSVLEDAYNSGYNTIWVLEDDIVVRENPHIISLFIDSLDSIVGHDGWDLLYTEDGYYPPFHDDRDKNLPKYTHWIWRPDMIEDDTSYLVRHKDYGSSFTKVGLKFFTHSLIIRRSGMKKILDFAKNQGLFLPIDSELAFIPKMNLFIVKRNIITIAELPSDTSEYKP